MIWGRFIGKIKLEELWEEVDEGERGRSSVVYVVFEWGGVFRVMSGCVEDGESKEKENLEEEFSFTI